ncbi:MULTISPECIES: hypothetical protein [unclassified Pseudomonas]|uniref:hypothetical protein n=1 Tax=unclassified Pseudomonas TaxID=196821 RepID=UPI00087124F7|nr:MULTISPECIES: hypothetical protein [unclassified Pseudomonas]SCW95940.1 hypothetical protein SAMN03159481_04108 [Pseudomonas sp. NFACC56-3]SFL05521.1 hypothetical protein SAMN03159473_05512 [Pseudomonas sp. NFACC52]
MSSKDKKVDVGFKGQSEAKLHPEAESSDTEGEAEATVKPEAVVPDFKGLAKTPFKPKTTPEP